MDQQPANVEVTRHDLYQQIWSMLVSKACRGYGLSDVGLPKICAAWNIPRPPRGYWAKKRNGKSVRKTKLTPIQHGNPVIFTYQPSLIEEPEVAAPSTESDRQREFEKRAENRISVPDELVEPHRFVARTEKSIRGAKPDENGIVRPTAHKCLNVAVSPALVDRSLRILDALLKALDGRGFQVSVTTEEHPQTRTRVQGEDIGFRLDEETKRREREPTAAENKEDEWRSRFPNLWTIHPRYKSAPTGRLILQITDGYGVRRCWSDRKDRRVEQFLNTFVVGLVRAAEAVKQERIDAETLRREYEELQRRRQEEELRRREEERTRQEEEARFRQLENQVAGWCKAEQIRAFVAAVRDACLRRDGKVTPGSDLEQWMAWAIRRADALDPIQPLRTPECDRGAPRA